MPFRTAKIVVWKTADLCSCRNDYDPFVAARIRQPVTQKGTRRRPSDEPAPPLRGFMRSFQFPDGSTPMKFPPRRLFMLIGFLVASNNAIADRAADRPNVVILLADDLGWGDVGYNGSIIDTPNIDRLAKEGVRLTNFRVEPLCSPTRASLMTGRWPIRYGMGEAVITPWRKHGLATTEHTLANLMADAGYDRRAAIGKWHLGHYQEKYLPLNRGFTFFYGHYNGAFDYFTHTREKELDWHRNWESSFDEGYSTDLIGREAVRFIEENPKGKPFFPLRSLQRPPRANAGEGRRHREVRKPRPQGKTADLCGYGRLAGSGDRQDPCGDRRRGNRRQHVRSVHKRQRRRHYIWLRQSPLAKRQGRRIRGRRACAGSCALAGRQDSRRRRMRCDDGFDRRLPNTEENRRRQDRCPQSG
jgi:hypothetical protein